MGNRERSIVLREIDPGYNEEFSTLPPSLQAIPSPSPPPLSSPAPPSPVQQQQPASSSSHHRRPCSAGGVQLRIKNRRSEPASRPHSWHSTKIAESQQASEKHEMESMSSAWHHSYHASASTTDLCGGFDTGISYLRKSPDQYSSRGSMESLDHSQSSQLHSAAHQHHPLGRLAHSGSHPAYSSCHQLSSARSSNSIDHLHNKRDSAYSSFSTSSSIPEYLASTPTFNPERSYSLETVLQRGGGTGEMEQADIRYVQTVYNTQRGQEHELSSTSATVLCNSDSRGGGVRPSRDLQGSAGGVCYRGSSSSSSGSSSGSVQATNRHSVGPIWGPTASYSSYESLRGAGAPAPPRRSDSYAAIRNHERPNSWSSLERARSLRSLQKGSCHHSSGPLASSAVKGSFSTEGQLHTVIEKSPESSPTIKPRQGGGFPQAPSPPEPSSRPAGPNPQSGRLILPTGLYPVPQPEPRYAQMPSSNPGPVSSGVYPALAQENSQQQHQGLQGIRGRDDSVIEGQKDGRISVTENGYQNKTSSSPYPQSSYSTSAASQLRTQSHRMDRPQKEESNFGHNKPHQKTDKGRSEGRIGIQRPQIPQGHHGQSTEELYSHSSQRPQLYQEQNQDYHIPQIQSTAGPKPQSSQEWGDSQTLVQSYSDRIRAMDKTIIHTDQAAFSRLGQRQPAHLPVHPQSQAPPSSASQTSPHHLSDSDSLRYQHWDYREPEKDREHPLTRLEIALAEVQQSASPDDSVVSANSHGNSNFDDGSKGPARSLSVLEKVSRFECRERSGKQRSHSTSHVHNKALRMTEKGCNSSCGADDLRNMLERSNSGTKAQRSMSYRGGSSGLPKYRTPADPSSALQRSRSSFQLEGSKESDSSNTLRQDIQEMFCSIMDTSSNRSYRDSLKDAQSKVLLSTSLIRRDFSNPSINPSPPAASPPVSSSSSHQPSSVPTKHHSLEKKAPKTMPKPQCISITPQSPLPVNSPHTPKERHMVTPEIQGQSPPALPSVPPVGPPALRICGRKRLTADQKKRSYSEPDNMNEVGVSDNETTALFRRGGETSVADRRKMFEIAASRVRGGGSLNITSKLDLRQLQHDALADFVDRKRGIKRDEGGQRTGPRPQSAYLQPYNSNHTVSSRYSDTLSLSSASSVLSLQDSVVDQNASAGERHLPAGADLRSLQSNLFYPGRVTSPRPPAHPVPSAMPQTHILQNLTPEDDVRISQSLSKDPALGHQQQVADPQSSVGLFKQLSGALQRAASARNSGKSASAEDLLERSEERRTALQHHRSRSSPTVETLNQDLPPTDVRMFGGFISEHRCCSLAENRPAHVQVSEGVVSPQSSQNSLNTVHSAGTSQDLGSSHTPVPHRERQRNCERQRAHNTSTLAASVGLPCPFSPAGTDGDGTDWQASENLAKLEAITFPVITQSSRCDGECSAVRSPGCRESPVMDRQLRNSSGDTSKLEDTVNDMFRGRAYSLEKRGGHSPPPLQYQLTDTPNRTDRNSTTSPSPPSSYLSVCRLSSLRISESSLFSSFDQQKLPETSASLSQEDLDDVFFQNPTPPSPPPITETSHVKDFPLPLPTALELEQGTVHQAVESPSSDSLNNSSLPITKSSLPSPPRSPSSSVFPPPVPSLLPSQPSAIIASSTSENSLCLEYHPLPKREKTSEELRVEVLARQLVLQDPSLAPLLDTRGSKSTVELLEEIFPNSRLDGKPQLQHRDSSSLNERVVVDGEKDINLDGDKKDLNARKVELCEALRSNVTALQQEKEALNEEQRHHQELGATIETLIQERLKTNERDKYSMFIGDLEKIVNLLLSLCSRLSRIDKSLLALEREELAQEDKSQERDSLHHKRSLILRQTEDAWELKENLDRRQRVVQSILSGYLTESELQDYRHFVSTKPSLLIRRRHLDDLIRDGEEQLVQLAESLPTQLSEAHGWSRVSPFLSQSPMPCSSSFPPLLAPFVVPGPGHSVRSTTVTSL
ncbi:protein Shroom3 isoform X6 [Channa argus]|uniref:protein Shroom3 isoform X6 n=1 Tax=Channa argus TaxID=215402 RepID=UPI0035208FB7